MERFEQLMIDYNVISDNAFPSIEDFDIVVEREKEKPDSLVGQKTLEFEESITYVLAGGS